MHVAASSLSRALAGIGPFQPVTPARSVRSGISWSLEDQAFGAALIRETRSQKPATGLYGPDARLRTPSSSGQNEEDAADMRTEAALERRDREVRLKEKSQGEAVGGSHFVYQAGPDGELYAVGSTAHVTRRKEDSPNASSRPGNDMALSDSEREVLQKLQARDAQVRSHETAHIMAAASQVVGGANYQYQTGPDGRQYAVGGSVSIAVGASSGDDEDAARQAETTHRAAMATGEPSLRDIQVAMRAASLAARARRRGLNTYAGQAPDYNFSQFGI